MLKDELKEIGITDTGYYSKNNSYIIDIDDSDKYGTYFSLLDKSNIVEEDYDSGLLTLTNSSLTFQSKEYRYVLLADFENDAYKLICSER